MKTTHLHGTGKKCSPWRMLKCGFAKDKITGSIWILGWEILHPQVSELLPSHFVLAARHTLKCLLTFLGLQPITGTHQSKFPYVNATIIGGIFQIEHEVHILILPVHHGAGILGIRIPHCAPFVHRNLNNSDRINKS